jgi:hypothetical protein
MLENGHHGAESIMYWNQRSTLIMERQLKEHVQY